MLKSSDVIYDVQIMQLPPARFKKTMHHFLHVTDYSQLLFLSDNGK